MRHGRMSVKFRNDTDVYWLLINVCTVVVRKVYTVTGRVFLLCLKNVGVVEDWECVRVGLSV